jgi:hypothetical protein
MRVLTMEGKGGTEVEFLPETMRMDIETASMF